MLVNKKLDRLKQWAGEKMGGEAKSAASDELKISVIQVCNQCVLSMLGWTRYYPIAIEEFIGLTCLNNRDQESSQGHDHIHESSEASIQ
jgi:hypothetical protein